LTLWSDDIGVLQLRDEDFGVVGIDVWTATDTVDIVECFGNNDSKLPPDRSGPIVVKGNKRVEVLYSESIGVIGFRNLHLRNSRRDCDSLSMLKIWKN